MATPEALILAQAMYDIRLLLARHLGSTNDGPPEVRQAAHLAYALHEQARQLVEGGSFDIQKAIEAARSADRMLNTDFADRLVKAANARL